MKYWENGFYESQNGDNTRAEITDECWQELLNAQSLGKDISTDSKGIPIAIEHVITQQELNKNRIIILKQELAKIKEDVEQVELFGMQREDYEIKKARCVEIILELRELEKSI